MVKDNWGVTMAKCPESSYSLDRWHSGVSALRTFLKGWARNIRGDYRRKKTVSFSRSKNWIPIWKTLALTMR